MAGSSSDLSQEDESTTIVSGINITPFVDVVLVLLVIFMITAPALVKEVLEIRLPKSSTGDGQVIQTFGVAINKEGLILLNGTLIDEDSLKNKIKETIQKSQDLQAIISADKEVPYGRVVHVIDVLKSSGLEKFAVQIEKESSTSQESSPAPNL